MGKSKDQIEAWQYRMDHIEDAFMAKVEKCEQSGCWHWLGALNGGGYGSFWTGEKDQMAHRFSYGLFVGNIPSGMVVDHGCKKRHCVNPGHLEAITQSENVLRGIAPGLASERQASKTHCPAGHPYAGENLRINRRGNRTCKACTKARSREHYLKKRLKRDGGGFSVVVIGAKL